ncbi:MAG TPA: hypothetical protein VEA44_05525 [Caulobacter sp.]|nr:hypothetical protein [Caulobacter sp.]
MTYSAPAARRLRVYAFDPQAALNLGSAKFGHATISLAWNDPGDGELRPGPVNDYLEVIDVDPASQQFYEPVDLDAKEVLAQDGLTPSEGDPRFHQQMVFAVAMKTIKLFERALGRKVIWAPRWDPETNTYLPTRKLRVYPHALREANAYYSRNKKALLFGYFNAPNRSAGADWIFTALSHDIIVHETTHAILDGLHRRYAEATSEDSLAFHEAFADIAALFSHFQLYEAVYEYVDRQRGALDQTSLLTGLAAQFSSGTTGHPSLREFIDAKPDQDLLQRTREPHARGAILVAAVFDAFLSIYKARTADLMRLSGAAARPDQPMHPDLAARLTVEATKCADHVLRMCIRALDYLPPVDVRFGEFLRAVITADTDLIPDDRLNYRLAFVEAFRRRGIFAEQCLSMSPDSLLWEQPNIETAGNLLDTRDILQVGLNLMPEYNREKIARTAESNRKKIWYWLVQPEMRVKAGVDLSDDDLKALLARARQVVSEDWPETGGSESWDTFLSRDGLKLAALGFTGPDLTALCAAMSRPISHIDRWELFFHAVARQKNVEPARMVDEAWEDALGIRFSRRQDAPLNTIQGRNEGLNVEVHSVRTTRRAGPDGQDIRQLVIEVTQKRRGYFHTGDQSDQDAGIGSPTAEDFTFRGGATMIIDLREGELRYIIRKRIDDDSRLAEQRAFLSAPSDLGFTYDQARTGEPFALLHRH